MQKNGFVYFIDYAQDTIRVAIGVSLRVKNQSDQNPIKYILLESRYVDCCWTNLFFEHSNLIVFGIVRLNMTPPPLYRILLEMDHWCDTQYGNKNDQNLMKCIWLENRHIVVDLKLGGGGGGAHSKFKFMYRKPECPHWGVFRGTDATYMSIIFLVLVVSIWMEGNIY